MKYPECHLALVGQDGNAFAVMGACRNALKSYLRQEGKSSAEIEVIISEYTKEAMSGDYDHLLQTTMSWVDVD
jgi:hypothetical protein